eukprot:GHRQ01010544.1.p1 GENE.GHRQ01010544.1~~GHRQ01010544.1.p1  ORF type:complete len:518 (+),score=94.88 GHRQ01010544.1:287-1840(+)
MPHLQFTILQAIAQQDAYDPSKVDWKAVVDACKLIGVYEKRMAGMIIRAGYHDAMSIDVACRRTTRRSIECGGADGSVLLSSGKTPATNEAKRNESQHRSYVRRVAKAVIPIAQKYNASVADTLAVCAMAVTSTLAGGGGKQAPNMLDLVPLKVGRIDRADANPENSLLPGEATLTELDSYWSARGMTLEEGVTLLGIHALMEVKGCMVASNIRRPAANGRKVTNTYAEKANINVCNPFGAKVDPVADQPKKGSCPRLQMYQLDTRYYLDLATPTVSMSDVKLDVGLVDLDEVTYKDHLKDLACSFSSEPFRKVALKEAKDERSGDTEHWPDGGWLVHNTTGTHWSSSNCQSTARDARTRANCNHMDEWPYTRVDGFMSLAVQAPEQLEDAKPVVDRVAASVKKYVVGTDAKWYADFASAYSKMMSVAAQWSPKAGFATFQECTSYVRSGSRDDSAGYCAACSRPASWQTSQAKARAALAARRRNPGPCPQDCVCANAATLKDFDFSAIACGVVCVP